MTFRKSVNVWVTNTDVNKMKTGLVEGKLQENEVAVKLGNEQRKIFCFILFVSLQFSKH